MPNSPASETARAASIAAEAITRGFVGQTVAAVEQQLIIDTLSHCLGNRTHAANILGISIRTLRNKLKEYSDAGISVPPPQQSAPTPPEPVRTPSRRMLIAGAAASLGSGLAGARDPLAAIEAKVGGRLGVAALDVESGRRLGWRADERFPMCSTFKAMAVAAVLKRVDAGQERLDRFVRYAEADLLSYAPVTKAHVIDGGMRLAELCAVAVELSDNTAANLILGSIGGRPAGPASSARSATA